MKKTLIAIGLLVCTTGVVLADEVTTTKLEQNATKEVQIQNELDKATFDKETFNQNSKKFNKDKTKDKIKYDDSINKGKFKNIDKKTKFKFDNKNPEQKIKNEKFNPQYQGHRPEPYKYMGHRYGHNYYNRYNHHPDIRRHHSHNPKFGQYHRVKLNKMDNKKAYRVNHKNIKRR